MATCADKYTRWDTPEMVREWRPKFEKYGWGAVTNPMFDLLSDAHKAASDVQNRANAWLLDDCKKTSLPNPTFLNRFQDLAFVNLSKVQKKLSVLFQTDLQTREEWKTPLTLAEYYKSLSDEGFIMFLQLSLFRDLSVCLTKLPSVVDEITSRYISVTLERKKPFSDPGTYAFIQSCVHAVRDFAALPEVGLMFDELTTANAGESLGTTSALSSSSLAPVRPVAPFAVAAASAAVKAAKHTVASAVLASNPNTFPESVDTKMMFEGKKCVAIGALGESQIIVSVFVQGCDLLKGKCLDAIPCWLYHKFTRQFLPRGGRIFYSRTSQVMRETMTEQSRCGPAPTWGPEYYKPEKDLGVSYPCSFVEQWYDKTFFSRVSKKNECFIVQQSYATYKQSNKTGKRTRDEI